MKGPWTFREIYFGSEVHFEDRTYQTWNII